MKLRIALTLVAIISCTALPLTLTAQSTSIADRIQALRAEIAKLQQQLRTLENLQTPCTLTNTLMTIGFRGESALCLQRFLNDGGFPVAQSGPGSSGQETSYFGGLTRSALIRWQLNNHIPGTGSWDSVSYATYLEKTSLQGQAKPSASIAPPETEPRVSQAKVIKTPEKLAITSFSPDRVRDGGRVTITGTGFTDNMTIIARFGALEHRIANISSPDGKTISFVFQSPVSPANSTKINTLPNDVKNQLTEQLANAGHTLDILTQYTSSPQEIIDPYTLIITTETESVVSKEKLNHVR